MGKADIFKFEEDNHDSLFDKFIQIPSVRDAWEAHVFSSYEKASNYDHEEDR